MYGIDESPTLVSRVTENVMESILDWQNKPLDAVYPKEKRLRQQKEKSMT